MALPTPTPEYITAREFDRFEQRLNQRLERTEGKIDALFESGGVNGRVIAKKAAVHVSWITPVVVAIIEGLKMAFAAGKP